MTRYDASAAATRSEGSRALVNGERQINRGDVYWVVQDDVFNHSRITTGGVCALTSNRERSSEPGNILLDPGEGDLPQQSVVVVSQVDSIEKARLGERIGTLSSARVDQILNGLRFQQASFFER
jgi:mRNA interferase MazF